MNKIVFSLLVISNFSVHSMQQAVLPAASEVTLVMPEGARMPPDQKSCLDEYVEYLTELNKRCSNPNRWGQTLTQMAYSQRTYGGMYGLALVRKDDRSVLILSCSELSPNFNYTNRVFGEELAKSIVVPYLGVWGLASQPVGLLVLTPHHSSDGYASERAALMQWSQWFYSGRTPAAYAPTLDALIHAISEVSCKASDGYRLGGLGIEFINMIRDRLVSNGQLSYIASQQVMDLSEIEDAVRLIGFQLVSIGDQEALSFALKQAGWLENLIDGALAKNKNNTLVQFIALHESLLTGMGRAEKTVEDPDLKSVMQRACGDLVLLKEQLSAFFTQYGPEWRNVLLRDFLLWLLKGVGDRRELAQRLSKFSRSTYVSGDILFKAVLFDMLSRYKHVVLLDRLGNESNVELLKQLGFKGQVHGVFAHPAEEVIQEISPFKASEIVSFLDNATRCILPEYISCTDPRFYPYNPFVQFVEDPFIADEIRSAVSSEIPVGRTARFVNSHTGVISDEPLLKMEGARCRLCERSFSVSLAAVSARKRGCYCSTRCFAEELIRGTPIVHELLKKTVRTPEERMLLRSLAALCALKYLALSPAARVTSSIFYQMRHSEIKELLTVLCVHGESHPVWLKVIDAAKMLSIDLNHLSIFCEFYSRIKKKYHAQLLEYARGKRFTELSCESLPDFDECKRIYIYQKKQYQDIAEAWEFSDETGTDVIPSSYLELLKLLSSQTDFSFGNLEKILTFERLNKEQSALERDLIRGSVESSKVVYRTKRQHFSEARVRTKTSPMDLQEDDAIIEFLVEIPDGQSEELVDEKEEPVANDAYCEAERAFAVEHCDFQCLFACRIPYSIRLYNVAPCVSEDVQTGKALWSCCRKVRDSYRIRAIIELAQEIEATGEIARTAYGTYRLVCDDEHYDASIKSRLDLHHLFPSTIETYVRKFGIAEIVEGSLIQVSLPGKIVYGDGSFEHGFFQLSYTPGSWTCIHRCFKRYGGQENEYISPAMRELLDKIVIKEDSNSRTMTK